MVLEGHQIEVFTCMRFIENRGKLIEAMNRGEGDLENVLENVKKSLQHGYPEAVGTTLYYETAFLIKAYEMYEKELGNLEGFSAYFQHCLEETAWHLRPYIRFRKNRELGRLVELLAKAGADSFVQGKQVYCKPFSKRWKRLVHE